MEAAAPLNVFQRLVRTWDAVHPYNAAQAITLGAGVAPDQARQAWEIALTSMALGRVICDGRNFHHEPLNGQAKQYPVRILRPEQDLGAFLTAELNRAFADDNEPPYRPFLLNAGKKAVLGLIYRHWIADSVSIRRLLSRWHEAIAENRTIAPSTEQGSTSYWDLFGRLRADPRIDQTALSLFRSHMRFRQVMKVKSATLDNYQSRVLLKSLPDHHPRRLQAYARQNQTTVGNLMLAALAESAWRHVPFQHRSNRPNLAVGNIVDLRPYASGNDARAFGLLLGFTHSICRGSDLENWPKLLRGITRQNQAARPAVAQASGAWMLAALAFQKLLRRGTLYHFYRKELPLAAGLSNVRIKENWTTANDALPVQEFLRVSPTGPMAPAVLSATTLNATMRLALTYRTALISDEQANEVLGGIGRRLNSLAGQSA